MKIKATIRFIEFVRPGGFWPHPYTLEQAFGVFRWMLHTGAPYTDRGEWGTHSILSLLSCKPSCVNFQEVDPITSVDDLERRFHYAILASCTGQRLKAWRDKFRVHPNGQAVVSFRHGGEQPECREWGQSSHQVVDALLNTTGRLGVQLNECHSRAREIYGVQLECRSTYCFRLHYGYEGSVWRYCLSRQLPKETFWQAFNRARRALGNLIDGKMVKEA